MTYKNDRFLQSLREVLAFDKHDTAIGAIIVDIIDNIYLPAIKAEMDAEPDEGRKNDIYRTFKLWKQYGARGPKEDVWTAEAVKSIIKAASRAGVRDDATLQDIASAIQDKIWMGRWEKLLRKLQNYDYNKGPLDLLKFWKYSITQGTQSILVATRKQRDMQELPKSKETGEELPIEDVRSTLPGGVKDRDIMVILDDMADWIRSKTSGDRELLFNMWEQEAKKKDSWADVNWSRDIFPSYNEITGKGNSWMMAEVKKLKLLMVRYLQDNLDIPITKRTLENLKLAERVAASYINPRFAAWMLELYNARRNFLASL